MAILPAHDGFAPSHTMPDKLTRPFTSVSSMISLLSPFKKAIPATLTTPADTTPQYAESLPMPDLTYSVNKLANTRARYRSSSLLPSSSAAVIIGIDTVKP